MAEKYQLNGDWRFHYGDAPGADYMGYDDRAWPLVRLPHDWAVAFPFSRKHSSGTGYLPGGTAVYRRHFTLPDGIRNKRVRVTFGGVYNHAQVWINSNYLGGRAYGYSTFSFEIGEFVRPGENVLTVRVSHEETADSRWYTGSGIYRGVTLTVSEVSRFTPGSIFVSTRRLLPDGSAAVEVSYRTEECEKVDLTVLDAAGAPVCGAVGREAGGTAELLIPHAKRWSPDTPYLYTLRCAAYKNGEIADTETLLFGVRTALFDPDTGFYLNGHNMKLKGVCVHHDAGCLGAAVPREVWARRLKKFKAMGCNAIRTAHNPPDPVFLDLCDELGFLVMDEAFDEWEGAKNKWWQGHNVYPPKRFGYAADFPFWHETDLRDFIVRDRNHPSVIMWSVGNEIDYPNDPYVTPLFDEVLGNNDNGKPAAERRYDDKKPDAGRLAKLSAELVRIAHEADPTRPVLSALSFPELSVRTGFAQTLDVWGYNYRERFYDEHHAAYPEKAIFGSENGHDPAAWKAVTDRPFIAGQFLWTGVDFLGECRGWPERISGAGALDLCGYEKPVYYQRMALWTHTPFVKLAVSRGEREKTGMWSDTFVYAGKPGEKMQVSCYTNAPAAELFLNGRSLGKKILSPEAMGRAVWEIPFEPGVLRAAVDGAQDELRTPGPAKKICLLPDVTDLPNDGESVSQIEVLLADENDAPAATHDKEIFYQLLGDGEILGVENGKKDDLTPYSARFRSTFRGRALVYVRAGTVPGPLKLFAYTKCGLSAEVHLREDENEA